MDETFQETRTLLIVRYQADVSARECFELPSQLRQKRNGW
jgi:hypothetical protein